MKQLLLFAIFSIALRSQGQDTIFKMDETGITDFLVITLEGKTTSDLYASTLNWVKSTYNSPEDVIKSQIENESIRIEGIQTNLINTPGLMGEKLGSNGRYQIEISFKDGRYKFDLISIDAYSTQYGWTKWYPYDNWKRYYKNGQLIKSCRFYSEIPEYFNSLNRSLKDYILNGGAAKGDW